MHELAFGPSSPSSSLSSQGQTGSPQAPVPIGLLKEINLIQTKAISSREDGDVLHRSLFVRRCFNGAWDCFAKWVILLIWAFSSRPAFMFSQESPMRDQFLEGLMGYGRPVAHIGSYLTFLSFTHLHICFFSEIWMWILLFNLPARLKNVTKIARMT